MKRNPVIEAQEREIRMLREQIARMRQDPGDIPFSACDNSCTVARPLGMQTNGGCRCDAFRLRSAVAYWRRVAEHRAETIRQMRDGDDFDARSCQACELKVCPDPRHPGYAT